MDVAMRLTPDTGLPIAQSMPLKLAEQDRDMPAAPRTTLLSSTGVLGTMIAKAFFLM
jgi:hypothetical protein